MSRLHNGLQYNREGLGRERVEPAAPSHPPLRINTGLSMLNGEVEKEPINPFMLPELAIGQ